MKKMKKVPLRKCVGCMEQKNKKELIRIVKNKDGHISIDFTGKAPGRGAYICLNTKCLQNAFKKKALNRALQQEIPKEIYDELEQELSRNE